MPVLVDSSVWINHLRRADLNLVRLLTTGDVLIHPAILGEIAAGSLHRREQVLAPLRLIPRVVEVSADEVLAFIEARRLFGKGLSWVDLHLLASCLAAKCDLLSADKALMKAFQGLS